MKHLSKSVKRLCVLVFTVILFISMSAVAFAADTTDTEEEISAVLAKINAEYGTNIYVLAESELIKYGLVDTDSQAISSSEPVNLEETLRYIAEVQIPQFERTTQEARIAMLVVSNGMNVLSTTDNSVIASKAIDYATAAVEAYITTDSDGNTVWGNILKSYCDTNMYQSTCFIATSTTAVHTDRKRTIYWTGDGDYIAYINGTHYYLYSGKQYASMYVGDYN